MSDPRGTPDPAAETRLQVDGEEFLVTRRGGGHDVTWVSGPHDPPHGFSSGTGRALTELEVRDAISRFLAEIDPDTGHLD